MIFILIKQETLGLKIIFAKLRLFYNIFSRILLSIKSEIMNGRKFLQFFIIILLSPWISVFSQDISGVSFSPDQVLDSLRSKGILFGDFQKKPEIELSVSQAVKFLQQRHQSQYWNNLSDPFRIALGQLIFNALNTPFDSTAFVLKKFPYDSLNIPWDKFYIWEPMRVRIPVNTFQQIPVKNDNTGRDDTSLVAVPADSLKAAFDTAHSQEYIYKSVTVHKDTTLMVVIDTLHEVTATHAGFPFRYFNYPYQSDSIKVAVDALLK